MLGRRISGQPLETILGWVAFSGRRVLVEPGVFVPRRRTELLAKRARKLITPDAIVVELCCGVGAVSMALADAAPRLRLCAVDLDPLEVRVARRNLDPLGVRVLEGDLYAPLPPELRGRVDVIVANAPYVPSGEIAHMPPEAREHEKTMALDGGPDGVALHRRIAAEAPRWLRPGGALLIETSRRQVPLTVAAMTSAGLTTEVHRSKRLAATVVIGFHAAR